jgi:hypothetical protein
MGLNRKKVGTGDEKLSLGYLVFDCAVRHFHSTQLYALPTNRQCL